MGIVDKMNELVDSIKGFFEQISTVFGFLDDPFGFTAEKLKEACLGFATKILPVFTEALNRTSAPIGWCRHTAFHLRSR